MQKNGVVYTEIPRNVKQDTIDQLRRLGVATVHEALGRLNLADSQIRPIGEGMSCAGPAITCYVPAGDNLMVHRALKTVRPGDVLVIYAQGYTRAGLWGELTSLIAYTHGAAGIVIDGGVRDTEAIRRMGIPLWARAIHAGGTDKNGAGAVNVPIVFGGTYVEPGDIVVADSDGILVVPRLRAEEAAEAGKKREHSETYYRTQIAKGEYLYDLYHMEKTEKELGVLEISGTYCDLQ